MKLGEITERGEFTANCYLGHVWKTDSYRQYVGIKRYAGKRAHPVFTQVVGVPKCPECGHGWGFMKPVGAVEGEKGK